jgi:hypothetical protein
LFNLSFDFQVIEEFDAPNGKFANSYGNVVVIDSKYFIDALVEEFQENIGDTAEGNILSAFFDREDLFATLERLSINEYALQADVGK